MPRLLWLVLLTPGLALAQEPRTKSRPLYSFEAPDEVARLAKFAENAKLETVQDVGVTQGDRCLRFTAPKGADYASIRFDATTIKDWADFDYLAIDVTTSAEQPLALVVELWDGASKNYATRCTYEGVTTRPGRQTLLYHIARARRNGKEGRDWDELQPQDRIDRNALTTVKVFLTPPKERDVVLFLDNIRLLQEDAAKPRFDVPLPPKAVAYKFASPGVKIKGFTTIGPRELAGGVSAGGAGWPDLFSGTFLLAEPGKTISSALLVPPGTYRYVLAAGPIYRTDRLPRFLLKLGDKVLLEQSPTATEYHSAKHLYRFLDTLYSERPNALWSDFVARMYPVHTGTVTVSGERVNLEFRDCFVSALVLVPEKHEAEFTAFLSKLRQARSDAFTRELRPRPQKKPEPIPGERDYVAYVPAPEATVTPASVPTAEERKQTRYDLQAAPGQRVTLRLAVRAWNDPGICTLSLQGKNFPDGERRTYLQNYRDDGDSVRESCLLPGERFPLEAGITWCWWVTFVVPKTAPPGKYEAELVLATESSGRRTFPVTLEVLPIQFVEHVPASFGMYYSPPSGAGYDAATRKRVWREQLQWLRSLGFTATSVGTGTVTGLNNDGRVNMTFDATAYELAKEVGFGAHPAQYQMGNTLPLGRAIGRRLPGSLGAKVDQQPGIELQQPRFADYFADACKQYRDFIARQKLPVAVEVVDEPREFPNPWNRNLADTLTYCGLVRKAGLTGFVTPMGDVNNGKDYSVLADATAIVSVHAYQASAKLMARTAEKKKTLWLYNTGMDRFSWGFYNWRAGSAGRWEWHFYFPEDQAKGGYPGREPYNPFTANHGLAPPAPLDSPGAMRFQSAFLQASEGMTDYAYLVTLEQRLRTVPHAEATRFLDAVRRAIPAIPGSKNLLTEADGPLVGMGLTDEARRFAPQWRRTLAGLLVKLGK